QRLGGRALRWHDNDVPLRPQTAPPHLILVNEVVGTSKRSRASRTHPTFSVDAQVLYTAMRGRSRSTVSTSGVAETAVAVSPSPSMVSRIREVSPCRFGTMKEPEGYSIPSMVNRAVVARTARSFSRYRSVIRFNEPLCATT